jgi:2-oxoglutarate dehydrogenase E1 component
MTPKSLLRHPLATSRASDLLEDAFQPVLDDPRANRESRRNVRRVVLCSGHVWADLESDQRRAADDSLAVVRVEQLYPFPAQPLADVLEQYRGAEEVIWLQEEPRNMGAWLFVEPRLREVIGNRQELRYVGRPERASPAEGWAEAHIEEQRRIISAVLEGVRTHAG